MFGDLACVEAIAAESKRQGSLNRLISWGNEDGVTPLMVAAQENQIKVVQYLLQNKADINAANLEKWGPLSFASEKGHADMVKFLLQNGANTEQQNDYGNTPLILAAARNHLNVASILLKNGADINVSACGKRKCNGITPLISATIPGNFEMVQLLIQSGAHVSARFKRAKSCDKRRCKYEYNTALQYADFVVRRPGDARSHQKIANYLRII